jgi:RHS repeat-associated protein
MTRAYRSIFFIVLLALTAGVSSAQVQTGTPPFGSFGGGPDVINLANLNSHLTIPVLHKPGRGNNFTYDLAYDSSVWFPVGASGHQTWQPVGNFGWAGQTEVVTGYVSSAASYSSTQQYCGPGQGYMTIYTWTYYGWVYTDNFGVSHPYQSSSSTTTYSGCGNNNSSSTGFAEVAADGSGYTLDVNGGCTPCSVISRTGASMLGPYNSSSGTGNGTDRNGNMITVDSSGHFYDTLSSTTPVLAVTGLGTVASPTTFTYTAPSGASVPYTMNYTNYTVATNFGISGVTEYRSAAAVPLVSSIVLPDGSQYLFQYEATPSTPAPGACTPYAGTTCVTARIWKVTLPTGGLITYTYTDGNNGILPDGSVATLNRATPDGTWKYVQVKGTGAASTTTITDPQGNASVINFQGIYETQRQIYQGSTSGTLLATTNTCYGGSASPCNGTAVTLPITQRAVITTLPSSGSVSLQSKSVAFYNTAGVPTEVDSYAFGSGAPPANPTRKTVITYASLVDITAFQQTVTVKDGNNITLAQTNYNYDETTPVAAPTGTPQLTTVSGSRGNLTSVQRCISLSSCSTFLKTIMTYDTAGQLQTAKDPAGNQTSFSYTDRYYQDNGSNPPAPYTSSVPTDAFVTTVTPPLNGPVTSGFYFYTGQGAAATDQNSNSVYAHFDSIGRPTTTYGPLLTGSIRPWSLVVYGASVTQADTYLGITDATASASCTSCRHDQVLLDGLGRNLHGYLVSDPEGQTAVDTAYDSRGNVLTTSHPHRSSASTTDGVETPSYDALGRVIKGTHQDNTFSQAAFGAAVTGTGVNATQLCSSATYGLAYPSLFTDEAGKKHEVWSDGLGRTIEADEPDSSGNLTSATCYAYDLLGNLLQIIHGSQTRTYAYDALSRVTSVSTPELFNCAVTYGYDGNSNLQTRIAPAPNQTACTTKVTTTYFYDAIRRLTKITYSDGTTPTVQYGYDATTLTGCGTTPPTLTDSNPKGLMTSMCDGSGSTSWAHDAAGRILTEKRTILGVTQTISYTYNLDGSIATVTYPSTKVVTYTVSNAQRLTAAKDVTNNIQFATAASYAPPGGLQGMITGKISGGFGGITEAHTYNNSLEYTSTQATSTAGTALNLTLNYNLAGGDNGTVTSITNNTDSGRTQSFTYDPLNRTLSAKSSATSGVDCWGQNFGPDGAAADDAVANLTKINNGTQTPPPCIFGSLNATVDANNHINTDSTYATDATGNMTKDGSGTGYLYTFDAEGRLTLAAGPAGGPYCYVYDGLGLRVAKKSSATTCSSGTVTKLYWRGISGDSLAETDGSGSVTNTAYTEYVFFAGRRIASRINSGNGNSLIFYYFADQLGSTRTITTGSGKNGDGSNQTPGLLCYDADFTPYGQEISFSARLQTTACPTSYKFTGYERDSETGLDYAFARYYSSRLGRFLSTDPLGGAIGVPQSHNAYAYVGNNALNSVDPSGMLDCHLVDCGLPIWGNPGSSFWAGEDALFGRMLRGAYGFGSPFDILLVAFTPTGPDYRVHNCANQDEDCGNTWLTPYGNWGLLGLLFQGTAGDKSSDSPCSMEPTSGSRQVLVVARDIGGPNGTLSGQGHAGLVFNVGTNGQPNNFIVQGGPTASGGLAGTNQQATAGWWQTFRMAQGANWSNPSAKVAVPVQVLNTFYLSAGQSTKGNLDSLTSALNSSLSSATYNYANGPNSNTYINKFIAKLCGSGFISVPNQIPLK